MERVHKLDCESAASDRRFIIQSEDEAETIEFTMRHVRDVHGRDSPDEEPRSKHLQIG